MSGARRTLLFVGAFPPPNAPIYGGMVTSCRGLLASSLPRRVSLSLLDTTQISVPPPGLPMRLVLSARRMARYVVRIERERPDAVLLFAALGLSLVEKSSMAAYARARGIPALLFPRGGGIIDQYHTQPRSRLWIRTAFRQASALLCQSERWHRFAVRDLGFDERFAPVIPNWTATPELVQIGRERLTRVDRARGRIRLLFLGWLDREKGIVELLDACRALTNDPNTPPFELYLCGEGNYSDAARSYLQANGLADVVTLRGWLRGADLLEALRTSHVLVLPSWAEGLPNAMVEAMAAGLAVVVTRVGSVPDVVTDERHALVVPPRDTNALTGAIRRMLSDESLRARLAHAGHEMAVDRFGAEAAADGIVAALESVLHARNQPPGNPECSVP